MHAYVAMVFVTAAAMMDLYTGKVKNAWICAGFGVGLLLMFLLRPAFGWSGFAAGVGSAFLIGWIPFRLRALGAGDVKVFMVLGCLLGGEDVLWCILFSFLFAAGIYLGRMLSLGQLKFVLKNTFLSLQHTFHYLQTSPADNCSPEYSKGKQAGYSPDAGYSEEKQTGSHCGLENSEKNKTGYHCGLGNFEKEQPGTHNDPESSEENQTGSHCGSEHSEKTKTGNQCRTDDSEKKHPGTVCGSGCFETGQTGYRVRFTIYILLGYVFWLGVKFCGVLA